MYKTIEEYAHDKFIMVPAKPLMAATLFTTKATMRYPMLATVRVFRNKDGMCEMWSTDTYRAVRIFWPDKVNDPDFEYDVLVDMHELKASKILKARPSNDDWVAIQPLDGCVRVTVISAKDKPVKEVGVVNLMTHYYDKFPNFNQLWGILEEDRVRSVPTLNSKYIADVFKCADIALDSPDKASNTVVEMIPGDGCMKPVMFRATNPVRKDARVEALVMPVRR